MSNKFVQYLSFPPYSQLHLRVLFSNLKELWSVFTLIDLSASFTCSFPRRLPTSHPTHQTFLYYFPLCSTMRPKGLRDRITIFPPRTSSAPSSQALQRNSTALEALYSPILLLPAWQNSSINTAKFPARFPQTFLHLPHQHWGWILMSQ
jgi:hypothetical protein